MAAARSAVNHLSSLRTSSPCQLIILEPNLDPHSSLPILPPPVLRPQGDDPMTGLAPSPAPATAAALNVPAQSRSKRVAIKDGLSWLFGADAVGVVRSMDVDDGEHDMNAGADADANDTYHPDTDTEANAPTHSLSIGAADGGLHFMRRARCGRGEWARVAGREGEVEVEVQVQVEGDPGGWRWSWC